MYPYQNWDTKQAQADYVSAHDRDASGQPADRWVAGGCGTETPYLSNGRWFLYVWNPRLSQHGVLDLSTDVVDMVDGPWGK
jgi:hypothetical protein